MVKRIRNDSENVYNLQGTYRWAAGETLEVPDEVAAHALEVHPDWMVDADEHRHYWRVDGTCRCGELEPKAEEPGGETEDNDVDESAEPDGDEPAEPDPSEEA